MVSLLWQIKTRNAIDRRNLIGGRWGAPHLIITGIIAPEKPDMTIDAGDSLKDGDVASLDLEPFENLLGILSQIDI